ncbi:hypothetical protein [Glycomyces sp. NPDC048151]|uniref:hypothetical protein n=1 Tax=Glycomyces sp. NPDC048151 TaxID=3364002 RepID=UPI00371AD0D5
MTSVLGETDLPGYVVLVDPDGSIRTVKTGGMDLATLAWAPDRLHFADGKADYTLTDAGLDRVEIPKAAAQNFLIPLADGAAVGVYNDGHTENGYVNQVAVSANGHGDVYDIEGNYFGGADCDGTVYGLAADPGAHLDESATLTGMRSEADPSQHPQMLAQLYPRGTDSPETVIAWRASFSSGVTGQVPCEDGIMTFLSDDVAADGTERGTVVTWNTRTGEHTTVPLSYSSTPALEADAIDYGHFDAMSLTGEQFEWVAPDGRFLTTDVSTGKTRLLFDTGIGNEVGGDGTSLWALGSTKVHAFHQDYTDDASPVTYHVFDRATGEQVTETELPIRSDEINVSYLGWWRMAVRPE